MKTDQTQVSTEKPIEFRFKAAGKETILVLNPNKFDSFAQIVADLRNYARDEMDNNNHLFLLRIAGQIEVWGLELFTLDYKHEGDQDWTKVLESLLRALAFAVEQHFYCKRSVPDIWTYGHLDLKEVKKMEIKADTLDQVYQAGVGVGHSAGLAEIALDLLCEIEELKANSEIDKAAALDRLAQFVTKEGFKSS